MGEGTHRVEEAAPKKQARAIEGEINEIRQRLDVSLAELDKRRHEATDWRLQVQRHPQVVLGAGLVVLGLFGGVAYAIYAAHARKVERERPATRAVRLKRAFGRMADEPEKVAKSEPTVTEKILGAVGTTVATMLAKKLMERAINSVPDRGHLP